MRNSVTTGANARIVLFDNQEVENVSMGTGELIAVAVSVITVLIIAAAIYWVMKKRNEDIVSSAERTARQVVEKAEIEADNIRKTAELESNERINQKDRQADKDNQRRKGEVDRAVRTPGTAGRG